MATEITTVKNTVKPSMVTAPAMAVDGPWPGSPTRSHNNAEHTMATTALTTVNRA